MVTGDERDERAFRAALAANPGDVTARGAYADWLDEHERPVDAALQRVLADPGSDARRLEYAAAVGPRDPARAEFVRVQVELARTPRFDPPARYECAVCGNVPDADGELEHGKGCYVIDPDGGGSEWVGSNSRRIELINRAEELHLAGRNATEWCAPLAELVPVGRSVFRRGFVDEVECTAADWLAHGDTIREAHPVARVALTSLPRGVDVNNGAGATTLTYSMAGLPGAFDLRDLRAALRLTDPPRALRTDEVVRGAFAIRYPGTEFELSLRVHGMTVPVLVTPELLADSAVDLMSAFANRPLPLDPRWFIGPGGGS